MALEILGYTNGVQVSMFREPFDNDGWWAYHLKYLELFF